MKNREFWLFLFFVGTFFFNWPFLDIFSLVLPEYFLICWFLFITAVGIVATFTENGDSDNNV